MLTLETVIQRVTDNPARRFGLTGRGRIEKGYFADVVVFDADRIIDTATFDDPVQHPVGIPYVLVNGQVAVDGASRPASWQASRCRRDYAGLRPVTAPRASPFPRE